MAGFRGAIFDMDGTLLESMREWRRQTIAFAKRHGVEVPPQIADRVMWTSSYDAAGLFAALYPQLGMDRAQIVAEYERNLEPLYTSVIQPKNGARAFLGMLRDHGVRMCVATATPSGIAKRALEHHGLAGYMEFVVCADEVGLRKTSEMYFPRVAEMLGVDKEETVVFEDAAYAIRSAVSAGMRVFAVQDECARHDWPEIGRLATVFRPDFVRMKPVVEAMFQADRVCSMRR